MSQQTSDVASFFQEIKATIFNQYKYYSSIGDCEEKQDFFRWLDEFKKDLDRDILNQMAALIIGD
jgi:hypothetical protein